MYEFVSVTGDTVMYEFMSVTGEMQKPALTRVQSLTSALFL